MLFRIENSEYVGGIHRNYNIEKENLPMIYMHDLDKFISMEIRKEINGAADRRLLSYSKSLGVCLLKYNKYADNEIHINHSCDYYDYIWYYDITNQKPVIDDYNLNYVINKNRDKKQGCHQIEVRNFAVDVSDNKLLDKYLRIYTGIGRKKMASPEKDKEVLLFQSPDDIVIKQYSDSVFLLYAFVIKYNMSQSLCDNIIYELAKIDDFRFSYCESDEKMGLILLVQYLYYNQKKEQEIYKAIINGVYNGDSISCYYDPITQFFDIQNNSFLEAAECSDYNSNVVSDCIWECYMAILTQ